MFFTFNLFFIFIYEMIAQKFVPERLKTDIKYLKIKKRRRKISFIILALFIISYTATIITISDFNYSNAAFFGECIIIGYDLYPELALIDVSFVIAWIVLMIQSFLIERR